MVIFMTRSLAAFTANGQIHHASDKQMAKEPLSALYTGLN